MLSFKHFLLQTLINLNHIKSSPSEYFFYGSWSLFKCIYPSKVPAILVRTIFILCHKFTRVMLISILPPCPLTMPAHFPVWAYICILSDVASCLQLFLFMHWWGRDSPRRLKEWLNAQHPILDKGYQQQIISHIYSDLQTGARDHHMPCRVKQGMNLGRGRTTRVCER